MKIYNLLFILFLKLYLFYKFIKLNVLQGFNYFNPYISNYTWFFQDLGISVICAHCTVTRY